MSGIIYSKMPVFFVYKNASQSISTSWTKLIFDRSLFDNYSFWNNTNNKYQPTIAGYYNITIAVCINSTTGFVTASLYKNGSSFFMGSIAPSANSVSIASGIVFLNGTTDYIEGNAYSSDVAHDTWASSSQTFMCGSLVTTS